MTVSQCLGSTKAFAWKISLLFCQGSTFSLELVRRNNPTLPRNCNGTSWFLFLFHGRSLPVAICYLEFLVEKINVIRVGPISRQVQILILLTEARHVSVSLCLQFEKTAILRSIATWQWQARTPCDSVWTRDWKLRPFLKSKRPSQNYASNGCENKTQKKKSVSNVIDEPNSIVKFEFSTRFDTTQFFTLEYLLTWILLQIN